MDSTCTLCCVLSSCSFQLTMEGQKANVCTLTQKVHLDQRDYWLLLKGMVVQSVCVPLIIHERKKKHKVVNIMMDCHSLLKLAEQNDATMVMNLNTESWTI